MNDNDNSSLMSDDFLDDKKKSFKKLTKLGKRPYNKANINSLKYMSKINQINLRKILDKNKRDYNVDKSNNIMKLAKEKYLYLPYHSLPDLSEFIGELIEVRIASEYLSSNNKAFLEKRIWGSDIYTSDSDVVCILQHSGYFEIKEFPPTSIQGVAVIFRVGKSRSLYNSTLKNGIKSKKLNNYLGHSIKPENYYVIERLGTHSELLEMASKMPKTSLYKRRKPNPRKLLSYQSHRDYNISFNLSNEIWWSYSLSAIADKSNDFKDFLSWRLKDKVLYLENNNKRYEISRNVFDHLNDEYLFEEFESFRFSEVLNHFEKDNNYMDENNVPLDERNLNIIFNRLDWHEFHWGENSLLVKKEFLIENLNSFYFFPVLQIKKKPEATFNIGNNLNNSNPNLLNNSNTNSNAIGNNAYEKDEK